MKTILDLQHQGVSPKGVLYVWADRRYEFESWETCSLLNGTLSEAEVEDLKSNIDSLASELVPSADYCPDGSFQMFVESRFFCWDSETKAGGRTNSAEIALAQLLQHQIDQLHWDGTARDCRINLPSVHPSSKGDSPVTPAPRTNPGPGR